MLASKKQAHPGGHNELPPRVRGFGWGSTLIGSSGTTAFSEARFAFTASNTWSKWGRQLSTRPGERAVHRPCIC